MSLEDLVLTNRSYRRFHGYARIEKETLLELVDLARLTPSAANLQPLRFLLSNDPEMNADIFEHLAWAGYLKDWPGPPENERPSAYILILCDTQVCKTIDCDHGIAAQTILLGAVERRLGGCIIGSIRRQDLRESLNIPERYDILLVLALGRPKENVVLESVRADGSIRYWRDDRDVHHVPKRSLDEVVIEFQV